MGVDEDLAGILREVVQFLESLCDIVLPLKIENARENLMQRSKTTLSTLSSIRDSISTGPYLEMNAGKRLIFPNMEEIDIEDYVGVEERPRNSHVSYQDYYESFQEIGTTINDRNSKITGKNRTSTSSKKYKLDEEAEEKLLEIYKTFTPAMTMNKSHKFGPLDHKCEKKSFGFVRGTTRSCWIGLVGSHLLIYSSEKDKQPPEIYSIRGYMGRPAASNTTFKDLDHSKSAFEIFCPGNKTLQFIAKNPREMEEWLAAISRQNLSIQNRDSGMYERSMDEKIDAEHPEDSALMEETYQDVGTILPSPKREVNAVVKTSITLLTPSNDNKVTRSDSEKKKDSTAVSSISPPILLARRLPSLPHERISIPSYEPLDDGYEEDDIYHKIEDFRDSGESYENIKKKSSKRGKLKKGAKKKEEKKKKFEDIPDHESYDEVENKPVESKKEEVKKKRKSLFHESPLKEAEIETYDDVETFLQQETHTTLVRKESCEKSEALSEKNLRFSVTSYDDILQPSSIVSTNSQTDICETTSKDIAISPTKSTKKSSQRKWFLDRVIHKKESPKKDDKSSVDDTASSEKKLKKKTRKVSLELEPQSSGKAVVDTELSTYDDVLAYQNDLKSLNPSPGVTLVPSQVEDLSNYNSLPRPRPIYVKPPNPVIPVIAEKKQEIAEDIYDDIGNYRDNDVEIEPTEMKKNMTSFMVAGRDMEELKDAGKSKIEGNCSNGVLENSVKSTEVKVLVIIDEEIHDKVDVSLDTEHYQTPRKNSLQVNHCSFSIGKQEQELYDDVAKFAEFRATQEDTSSSSSHDISSICSIATVDKMPIGNRKAWNRFGRKKKLSLRDLSPVRMTIVKNKSCTDLVKADDNNEKSDEAKPNKFQKLINKMESSLRKQPSTKSVDPATNKTHNCE